MKPLLTKFLIFSITIISVLVSQSDSPINNDDKYNRTFSDIDIFYNNGKEFTEPKRAYLSFINSDDNLAYSTPIKENGKNYKITFIGSKTFNPYRTEQISIQDNAIITYVNAKSLFYRHLLNFYRYDFDSGISERINDETTTIFDFIALDNSSALCLGNVQSDSKNSFAFFTLDLGTGNVQSVNKVLQSSENNLMIANSLKYTGEFAKNGELLSYVFDFYGKVLVFEANGAVSAEINTIDKIEAPQISHFMDTYTYKRGTTFFTNAGTLIKGNNLFSFSCRPNDKNYLTIDRYDLTSGDYKDSFKLHYQNKKSSDINYISSNESGEFVLGFDNFYQGFNADLDFCKE